MANDNEKDWQKIAEQVIEERDVLRLQVDGAVRAAIGLGGSVVPSFGDVALPRVEKERDEAVRSADEANARVERLIRYARAHGASFDDVDAGLKWIEAAIKSATMVYRVLNPESTEIKC